MIQPLRLKKLVQKLVDIYSPSGKEGDLLDFLRGYLKRRGLPVTIQSVDENRYNLVVDPGEADIRLALIGHVDTVPAYDLEQYGFSEQGAMIKGLGTADMKGGCAAMVEAVVSLWEAGHTQLPVALCLVVGEEETGDGAAQLMKSYHFPWAIIGEPTNLTPCFSCYGYLEIQLAVQGKRRHASLSSRRENAIEVMMNNMLRISHHLQQNRPELVYNIRDLFSSPAGFAVPERCEAWLDIHLPPSAPIGEIVTELEEISTQRQAPALPLDILFRNATIDAGYELPAKGPVIEALHRVYDHFELPWQTEAFISHSDANQIWAAGTKPILLGPGQLAMAHTRDEAVSFEQVCQAAKIYTGFIRDLFAL